MTATKKHERLMIEELPHGGFVVSEPGFSHRGEIGVQLAAFRELKDALHFIAEAMRPLVEVAVPDEGKSAGPA